VLFESSKLLGSNNLDKIEAQLKSGHNVILLANHQTEPDPQAISLRLEKTHPKFAEEMIFVAGHRVITDPLAVPFSMGRNLLCIFSKKYVDIDPATKEEKMQHNQRTMKKMTQLLTEGGKCIYVAPSGGRDRPNAKGVVEVAHFDPQSIEMFRLMALQAGTTTHFYPLALATYALLPPPNSVEKEIGEKRQTQCAPIHLAFGSEIDMERLPGTDLDDKRQIRRARADAIWEEVKRLYREL
jgi:glycerol-3-phosphate O-acyltransferase